MANRPIEGAVYDAESCFPVKGVRLQRTDGAGAILEETTSDAQGRWRLSDLQARDRVSFTLEGFVRKVFEGNGIPGTVRLLEKRLIGFQEKLWFTPGETVRVFVHAPVAFSATLFRHGFEKECILELGVFKAQQQGIPDGYFVEGGLQWETSFTYRLPGDCKGGLYSLVLEAENQESFVIPMVLSTPSSLYGKRAKLLVLASTNTWQAYNSWGGRSRYRNFEDGATPEFYQNPSEARSTAFKLRRFLKRHIPGLVPGKKPAQKPDTCLWEVGEWELKTLSIRRPFLGCGLEDSTPLRPFTNHLAGGEWRVLAWLEREGIPYDMVTGFDLHKSPDLLKRYRVIVLSTHAEYWSREMFEGLREAHETHGLWICNLSGNAIFREVSFSEDGSLRCVSAFFNRSCEDETRILGVRYNSLDYGTCAPYRILKRNHWIFSGIPLNEGDDIFGTLSLNQNTIPLSDRYEPGRPGVRDAFVGRGASGWETDKLVSDAPEDMVLVAKGLNPKGGADMVVRDPSEGRGGLFSASSILFGGALLIDEIASVMVKNILHAALST